MPRHLFQKMKAYVHTKICIQMFITALFVIDKSWNQPSCSSTGDWLKNPGVRNAMD